ncbi:ATP-grasp domain-containing protein [Seongchinamella unica]|uniref:ATP-grasp domain-containing protein n=1 Tax=Seongchinamella unica TaxID=2547392 RepID=A0A4R5LNE3_9GAMM|nr:ATP-grasp domain-containing protein [Seongchinamella unica]TDG11615.1 ATP-grasp domain-containing protein [Seongchinamella unica]
MKKNILIFPAGSEIGLEIHASLKHNKHFSTFAASSIPSHANCVFPDSEHILPHISDSGFIDGLNQLLTELEIDYIFPAHDEVILALAKSSQRLAAELLCVPWEICQLTQYKANTYTALSEEAFVPRCYSQATEIDNYPVFRKPSRGQNSIGAHIVDDATHLQSIDKPFKDHVITEYLPGREYTVDCFSTRSGELLFCQPRERLRTKYGISMHSLTTSDHAQRISEIARKLVSRLGIFGGWFFQVREDKLGVPKLLEVAPRIAGTSVSARFGGVNLAALTIYDAMGIPVSVIKNDLNVEIERSIANRVVAREEFDSLVIDLDDTLITPDNRVCIKVLSLIYQYRETNRPVTLVSRHARDIRQTLDQHCLSSLLFDSIVHLQSGEPKSDHMPVKGRTLFVDDAFAERLEVSKSKENVVVIDVDAVDGFIDYRRGSI